MIRLAKGVLLMLGLCFIMACGRREVPLSKAPANQPVNDQSAAANPAPVQTSAYIIDKLDQGQTMGSVIDGRYYLTAMARAHVEVFEHFRREVASLEAKGWVIEPASFRVNVGEVFLFSATFVQSEKRMEEVGLPPELIMENGQGR